MYMITAIGTALMTDKIERAMELYEELSRKFQTVEFYKDGELVAVSR